MTLIPLLSVVILMATVSPITPVTVPNSGTANDSTEGDAAHSKQSVEVASSVKVFNAPDPSGAAVDISKSHGGPVVGNSHDHHASHHHDNREPHPKPEHHSSEHHGHKPSFSDALSHMSQAFRLGLCNKFGWCMPFPKDNYPSHTGPIAFPSTAHFETEYDKDAFHGMGSSSSHEKKPFGMIYSMFHGWHDDHDSSSIHGSKPNGGHRIPHQMEKPGHHHDGNKHHVGDNYHGSHGPHQSTHKPDHGSHASHDHHQSHTDSHHNQHEQHGVAAFLQSLVKPSGPLKPAPIKEEHHHHGAAKPHHSAHGPHHGDGDDGHSHGSGLFFTDAHHSSKPHTGHHQEPSAHHVMGSHGGAHHGEVNFGSHHHGTTPHGHLGNPHGSGGHASGHHSDTNDPHHHPSGGSHGGQPHSSHAGHHPHHPEPSTHGHHDSHKGHHAGGHHPSNPHKGEHRPSIANSHNKPFVSGHPGGLHHAGEPNKNHPYKTTTFKPFFGLPWSVKKFLLV